VKFLLTILIVLSVSLASASTAGGKDSASVGPKPGACNIDVMVPAPEKPAGCESIAIAFPPPSAPKRVGPKSFFSSVRAEMQSLALTLPDFSVSLFGVSCYVRNPLKHKLAPNTTFENQIGFSTGDWLLNINGLKANTLRDLDVALQFPTGADMRLFFRYSDMIYKLDLQAIGRMPWEW